MNTLPRRVSHLSALALLLLLSACGGGDPAASVPINGAGGSGGGGSPSGSTGATATAVPILSHNPGQNCMNCHVAGGTGAGKGIFTVAGTVVDGAGKAQMRGTVVLKVHGTNTVAISLPTDGLGNFFTTAAVPTLVPAAGQQFAVGADVSVTTAAGSHAMAGVITNGSCNGCHGPGGGTGTVSAAAVSQLNVSANAVSGNGELPTIAIAQIVSGGQHSCVVKTDGSVLCWGSNTKGQTGTSAGGSQAAPALVTVLGGVRISSMDHSIATGDNHSCAIAAAGDQVLCWGANDNGQLGNGTTEPASLSTLAIAGVTALSAAGDSTCAQVGSGEQASIYCWGKTSGVVTTPQRLADTAANLTDAAIELLHPGVRAIAHGGARNCALLEADPTSTRQDVGAVQCGSQNAGVIAPATMVPLLAREISAGQHQSCAINDSGLVKCWDDIDTTGTGIVTVSSALPVTGAEATQFVHIASGADHSCGITTDNRVKCWGKNDAGQLGQTSGAPLTAVDVL